MTPSGSLKADGLNAKGRGEKVMDEKSRERPPERQKRAAHCSTDRGKMASIQTGEVALNGQMFNVRVWGWAGGQNLDDNQ